MLRRPAATLGLDPRLAAPSPHGLPADLEALSFRQHLREVGVVEVGIVILVKAQDPVSQLSTEGIASWLTAALVGQTRGPLPLEAGQQPLGLTIADPKQPGGGSQG
jgi:hypothetical protein